jgi:hypothetical protein
MARPLAVHGSSGCARATPKLPAVVPVGRGLRVTLLHRIDAWGVAFVICALALVIHDAVRASAVDR